VHVVVVAVVVTLIHGTQAVATIKLTNWQVAKKEVEGLRQTH